MTFANDQEREFWMRVYIHLMDEYGTDDCSAAADRAVEALRERTAAEPEYKLGELCWHRDPSQVDPVEQSKNIVRDALANKDPELGQFFLQGRK